MTSRWRRAARLERGAVQAINDNVRDVRGSAWLDPAAMRPAIRRPCHAAAPRLHCAQRADHCGRHRRHTAIFSVADGVLLKPLSFQNADRLFAVWKVRPDLNRPRMEAAPLNFVDWAREAGSFEALAA